MTDPVPSRNARFRRLLTDPVLAHAMSAHNPLSALLAAEAGFDAVWGSGFELSASHAVPDASILSPVQHLDMMRAMAAASPAPVIADIDTGFGNAINVAYLLPQYEAAGVSAVVMEDKTFPKDTSLRAGGRRNWRVCLNSRARSRPRGAIRTSVSSPAARRDRRAGAGRGAGARRRMKKRAPTPS